MSDSDKPRHVLAPIERFNQLIEREGIVETICANISIGGSLNRLCEDWKVNPGLLTVWLNGDPSRMEKLKAAYESRKEWVREEIFSQMKDIATSDIRKIYDDEGNVKHPTEWPANVAAAVQAIDQEELTEGTGKQRVAIGQTKKIKFHDKVKALQTLGKEVDMFGDKEIGKGLEDLAVLLGRSWGKGKDESE